MSRVKQWVLAGVLGGMMFGLGMMVTSPATSTAQPPGNAAYWRYHDGHWNYWYPADKRWYYTDGTHWYYHDNDAWHTYGWDRGFGREGFERGTYRAPGTGVEVTVPRHGIWRP